MKKTKLDKANKIKPRSFESFLVSSALGKLKKVEENNKEMEKILKRMENTIKEIKK